MDGRTVVLKADEAFCTLESGLRVSFRQFSQVTFHHLLTIDPDAALRSYATDAHGLPLAGFLGNSFFGRLYGINGASKLCGLQILPFVTEIIKNLNFHAGNPRRTFLRGTYENTAVTILGYFIFHYF